MRNLTSFYLYTESKLYNYLCSAPKNKKKKTKKVINDWNEGFRSCRGAFSLNETNGNSNEIIGTFGKIIDTGALSSRATRSEQCGGGSGERETTKRAKQARRPNAPTRRNVRSDYAAAWPYRRPGDIQADRFTDSLWIIISWLSRLMCDRLEANRWYCYSEYKCVYH